MMLGELIAALEAADPDKSVPFGFDHPHSYRGYYNDLAFEPARNVTVAAMLSDAREALGATYQGWKGGDYEMDEHTDCWIASEGCTGETIGPLLVRLMLTAEPPEPTTADELRAAAAKVRDHAEIFGGAAEQIALLLERVAEAAEDGGIQTSIEAGVLDAARAINGTSHG